MHPFPPPKEVELKFALPTKEASALVRSVARVPALSRRKAVYLQLHNTYFDTPDQLLQRKKIALRTRLIGSEAEPRWVQTLKMGGTGESALSQRTEWEVPVPDGELVLDSLLETAWADFDPSGKVFDALQPCFVTKFDRTSWTIAKGDGSAVEVSLDIGEVLSEDKSTPICELEIELLKGGPEVLFSVAQQIAGVIPLMPLCMSKAERGYSLAQGMINAPLRAQPPLLTDDMTLAKAARSVLRETFRHFTTNLNSLGASDDPEVLHQARVGWRRFKSALRLFKRHSDIGIVPAMDALQPLLGTMTAMRELDVAVAETLPMFANEYTGSDPNREARWREMAQALGNEAHLQRQVVCDALLDPSVGSTLIAVTQWLECAPFQDNAAATERTKLVHIADWASRRAAHLFDQLKAEPADSADPEIQHRIRIISKRLRYCIEAFRPLLPKQRAKRWYRTAIEVQAHIGAIRDIVQAVEIATRLSVDNSLVEFLRGISVGKKMWDK